MIPSGSAAKAIVFGIGGNAYDTVKCLARHDIPTLLLTSVRPRDGKYPGASLLRCPPVDSPDELLAFLGDRLLPDQEAVLLPTTDEFTLFLARHGPRLDGRFLYCQSDSSVVEAMCDKVAFHRLCQDIGVSCPACFVFNDEASLEAGSGNVPFPSILKRPGAGAWSGLGQKKGVYVRNRDELLSAAKRVLTLGGPLLVQEWIPGDVESIWFVSGFYDDSHLPEKIFVGRKTLQFPLRIGVACDARLIWDDEAAELASEFARKAKLSGLVDIEFKRDARSGNLKIIEVNARIGQFHRLGDDGCWNLPAYYFHRIIGRRPLPVAYEPHRDGRRWIHPQAHLISSVEEFGLLKGVISWTTAMSLTQTKCAWDVWDARRWLRFLRDAFGYIRRMPLATLLNGSKAESGSRAS